MTFFPQFNEGSSPGLFQKLKERLRVKPVLSGAAALLMLLFIILPFSSAPEVYAYVSVDINPSFEFSIDQDQEVVDVKAFNEEAQKMLQQMADPEGKSIITITEEIIDLSSQEGYMDVEKRVTLTTVFTKEAKTKDISSIEKAIKEFSMKKFKEDTVDISLIDSSFEVRDEAAKAGMTSGQLINQKEEALKEKESEEVKEKKPVSPLKNEEPKKDSGKEKPEEIPAAAADKRPEHVKEKQAEKNKGKSHPQSDNTNSTNRAEKNKDKHDKKNGNGNRPPASDKKHSNHPEKQEKNGNGSNGHHKQEEQQKDNRKKENEQREDKRERQDHQDHQDHHDHPKNKGKGNGN